MDMEFLRAAGQSIINESLTDKVYNFLENSILEMRLKPGDQLNEVDIANALNVSRSPVREALLRLEHNGLVNKSRKFRTVSRITEESIANNYHLWSMTESYAAALACEVATEKDISSIEEALAEMKRANKYKNINSYRELNNRFHTRLVEPCPVSGIVELHRNALNHIKWCYNYTLMDAENMVTSEEQHSEIFNAYKTRDTVTLERILRTHIDDALERMLSYFKRKFE